MRIVLLSAAAYNVVRRGFVVLFPFALILLQAYTANHRRRVSVE